MDVSAIPVPLTAERPADARGEWRALVGLAAPLVGANLLQMAVYAIDVVFVARLGTVEFAAATLGVFLYGITMWSLMSMATACAPLIAAELGRRRHAVREVRRSFRMALWLGAMVAVPGSILLLNGERLFLLAGQDARVAARAGDFLDILFLALLPSIFAAVMRTVAAALGRPGWALGVTAMAVGLGLLFNWLLVFGNLGFPALGLEGSAIASVLTVVAMLLAYGAILSFDPKLRRYRLFGRWWRAEWSRLAEMLRIGVPIALTVTLEAGLFGGAALLMGLIGVTEVAAHAIALNIASLAFQVPLGVAQAATIRVGMGYGARDAEWVAPAEARVVALAVQYLAVGALFQLFDGAQAVAAGVLRGLQDTRVPMVIAGLGYWIAGFGTAIALGFWAGWQGVGIWAGLCAGLIVVSAALLWRFAARERLGLLRPRTA